MPFAQVTLVLGERATLDWLEADTSSIKFLKYIVCRNILVTNTWVDIEAPHLHNAVEYFFLLGHVATWLRNQRGPFHLTFTLRLVGLFLQTHTKPLGGPAGHVGYLLGCFTRRSIDEFLGLAQVRPVISIASGPLRHALCPIRHVSLNSSGPSSTLWGRMPEWLVTSSLVCGNADCNGQVDPLTWPIVSACESISAPLDSSVAGRECPGSSLSRYLRS